MSSPAVPLLPGPPANLIEAAPPPLSFLDPPDPCQAPLPWVPPTSGAGVAPEPAGPPFVGFFTAAPVTERDAATVVDVSGVFPPPFPAPASFLLLVFLPPADAEPAAPLALAAADLGSRCVGFRGGPAAVIRLRAFTAAERGGGAAENPNAAGTGGEGLRVVTANAKGVTVVEGAEPWVGFPWRLLSVAATASKVVRLFLSQQNSAK